MPFTLVYMLAKHTSTLILSVIGLADAYAIDRMQVPSQMVMSPVMLQPAMLRLQMMSAMPLMPKKLPHNIVCHRTHPPCTQTAQGKHREVMCVVSLLLLLPH